MLCLLEEAVVLSLCKITEPPKNASLKFKLLNGLKEFCKEFFNFNCFLQSFSLIFISF